MAEGFQVKATRSFNEYWDLDVGYFQLDHWSASASVPGNSWMITDAAESYFPVTNGFATYSSALYLGEINIRRHFDWLTLLAGFRMGELNERYLATGSGAFGGAALSDNAFNRLYGFQFGGDIDVLHNDGPWRINTLMKGGVYGNAVTRNARRTDIAIDDVQTVSGGHAAFIGELRVSLAYQFTRNLSAHVLYQAMWLNGVALAPEQIGVTNFGAAGVFNANGDLFINGVGLGLDLAF